MLKFIALVFIFICTLVSYANSGEPEPNQLGGADVFLKRCSLCHGSDGMGEGLMPLKIVGYPNTNLLVERKAKSRKQIYEAVVYGGKMEEYSPFMPPMGDELTWTELESVVDFVLLLRNDNERAVDLISKVHNEAPPGRKLGQQLFESRCVLCHGKYGEGNGRMSKVIKSPPPSNLVKSRLPDSYLKEIISKGGAGVGRSDKMPPWGKQFNDTEILSIIIYLKSLRE